MYISPPIEEDERCRIINVTDRAREREQFISATKGDILALVRNGLLLHVAREMYAVPQKLFDAVKSDFGAVEVKQGELAKFAELVAEYFSLDEMDILCYDIGVGREDIAGDNKIEKAAALVDYAAQRMKLLRLVAAVISRRQDFDWIKLLDFTPDDSKD